jgi:hypothetical protein
LSVLQNCPETLESAERNRKTLVEERLEIEIESFRVRFAHPDQELGEMSQHFVFKFAL